MPDRSLEAANKEVVQRSSGTSAKSSTTGRVSEGRIAEEWVNRDELGMLMQMGKVYVSAP